MTLLNLSPEEDAVYQLIAGSDRITQLQIAKHEKWLGIHPIHESHLNIDKSASTLRKIRQLVRDMRIKKGVFILSDKKGYFLMKKKCEAEEYLKRAERTFKAQRKSWEETYRCMQKNFGIKSDYFEQEESNKIKVREHTRRSSKPSSPSKGITQDKLF